MPETGADPIWSEPELAPGPRTSGAGGDQKSGVFATVFFIYSTLNDLFQENNVIPLEGALT